MANVFLNDLKLQKVWDAIRKNFYPVPPESGTAQPPTPAMEGDITIAFGRYTSGQYQGYLNSIVSTIGDGKVTTSKLADSAVTKAKLAAGAIDPVVTWGNGTTAGPTITIQAGKDTSVPKAVPAATAEYSGIITTTTQTMSGNKTFKGNILGEQNIEALFGVSAHGHADLSIAAGGGAGTVTCISVNDAVKEPDGTGMITLDDYPTLTAYNADKTQINSAISQINSKIPIAATASNQLADKDFVNSSINTATATFRGTYTAANDTEAAAQTALAGITTKDLNDYAFVKVENTPQTGIDKYKRYKYDGSSWQYEYTLNNSSFTSAQWDAINSTITSAKVAAFNAKYDKPSGGIPKSDLAQAVQTSLGKADSALQRSNFVSIGDHDTPVYFDASGYGQVIDALSIPGNIESTGGGVAAHGHADLGVSAGGGSGTTTAVRIGNGSPIEAVDGVVTIPTTQISQQPDGTIALGGVAIAVKGLGSFAYRSSINLSEVVGATDVVSSLSNAISQTHAMAEDNAENISLHDDRITDLESYFDGASAKYALDADTVDGHHASEFVGALGVSGNNLTWTRIGGTAQNITVPYATNAGTLGGVAKEGLFTLLENNNDQLSATIGTTNKKLTLDYAKRTSRMRTELKADQEFVYRQSPQTIDADSLVINKFKGRTLVWNQNINDNNLSGNIGGTFNGITISYNSTSKKFHIQGTSTGTVDKSLTNMINIISGHKYLLYSPNIGGGDTANIRTYLYVTNFVCYNKQLVTASTSSTTVAWYIYIASGQTVNLDFNAWFIDLTLMFGSGNEPTSVADFERDYGYLLANPEYNAGELINNACSGLETVGFNILVEQPINYQSQSFPAFDKTKYTRVFKGVQYYLYHSALPVTNWRHYYKAFDLQGNLITASLFSTAPYGSPYYNPTLGMWVEADNYTITSTSMTFAQDCYIYIGFGAGGVTTSTPIPNTNFNKFDSAKNGQYEPYKRNVLDLHLDNIQVKSPNIWDEEWEAGGMDADGTLNNTSNQFRSKNYIPVHPNGLYYYKCPTTQTSYAWVHEYDKDKNWLRLNNFSANSEFSVSERTAYIKFRTVGSTYNNDICINESSAFNGQYEPHGILTINGLKQAGSVYDEIVGNKLVKRVGSVDLGTLNWGKGAYIGSNAFFAANIGGLVQNTGINNYANGISSKYTSATPNMIANRSIDKIFAFYAISNSPYVFVYDSAYISGTAGDFKTEMSGTLLNYELATPIEYELVSPIPAAMPAGTTERIISDRLPVTPFACDMTYGTNPGNILASGIAWEKIWGRPTIVHDKSNVSLTTLDRHVINIGDKELYLIFSVGSDGTSYTLRVATGLNNGVYENEQVFNFATIDDTTINNICHL